MESILSEKEIDKQEALTSKKLEKVVCQFVNNTDLDRPEQSLIHLMDWAVNKIKELDELNYFADTPIKLSNSKITIDGCFLKFCEEQKIKVKCLFHDALSTWKTEHDSEHFLSSGIFKISCKDFHFYHCALFHKGSKNEDDVSFFIIISNNLYEKYINLRNKYSDWVKKRNREVAEIEVIGNEPITYTRNLNWDSICLEDRVKESVVTSVEGFLKNEDYLKECKFLGNME